MKSNLTTTEKKLIENIARKEGTRPEDRLIMHYQKTERVEFHLTLCGTNWHKNQIVFRIFIRVFIRVCKSPFIRVFIRV